MNITIRNNTNSTIAGTVGKTEAWRIADVGSQAANLARQAYSVGSANEVVMLWNALKLQRASTATFEEMLRIVLQETPQKFGPAHAYHSEFKPLSLANLFDVSFWNDIIGNKSGHLFIVAYGGSAIGALSMPVRTIGTQGYAVENLGLRETDDGRRLHRWGQGGAFSGFRASYPPGLAHFGGRLNMFYCDHRDIRHATSDNGLAWESAAQSSIGFSASGGVCPLALGDDLALFFRDGDGNGLVHVFIKSGGRKAEKPPYGWYCGIDIRGEPVAVTFRGSIVVAALANGGDAVLTARFNLNKKSDGWKTAHTGKTSSAPPGLVVFRDRLHLFYRDLRGNGIFHSVSDDGERWTDATPHYIGFDVGAAPRAVVYRDHLYLLIRDGGRKDRGILAIRSADGVKFEKEPDWYIGLNTSTSAATIEHNQQLVVVVADDADLMSIAPDLDPRRK